jgi:hypothetical protein
MCVGIPLSMIPFKTCMKGFPCHLILRTLQTHRQKEHRSPGSVELRGDDAVEEGELDTRQHTLLSHQMAEIGALQCTQRRGRREA